MSLIARLVRSLRRDGPVAMIRRRAWIVEDVLWDRRLGVQTRAMVGPADIGLTGPNAIHASVPVVGGAPIVYATPRIGALRHALRAIPAGEPRHLVDYGCGRGRVLIAARQEGYETAVGIELSATVAEDARRNLDVVGSRRPDLVRGIEVVTGDAVEYAIASHQNVFYFYNPFGPAVLEPVLDAIGRSVRLAPRPVWIIYLNHVHRELLDERPELHFVEDLTTQQYQSSLYRLDPASA